jgi:hypothetical protein
MLVQPSLSLTLTLSFTLSLSLACKFTHSNMCRYIEELLALQHSLFYLQDAVESLLLWRGTLPITVSGKKYKFPIHSLIAFVTSVLLVENPELFPSLFFAMLGWVFLVSMDYRRNLPDPWSRCKTFREFILTLVFGNAPIHERMIRERENEEEARAYIERWKTRVKESEVAAAKAYKDSMEAQEEYEREMEEISQVDTDLSTKSGGITFDPFKPILYPLQQNLALVCRYTRRAKHIFCWQECYIAFWITAGCFLVSFIFLFVPWFFLLKWISRLIVWTLFGPWMKLIDVYYLSQIKPLTEEEILLKREQEREKRRMLLSAAVKEARIKRENVSKLKAMKQYMFGRFITRVPVLKEDRYSDIPLPDSSATPYRPKPTPLSVLAMEESGYRRTRVPGQHLVGDMIPRIETMGFTEAPIGQATAHPRLVDHNGPGGAFKISEESTLTAYATIGSLTVAAATISWFAVPALAHMAEKALHWM